MQRFTKIDYCRYTRAWVKWLKWPHKLSRMSLYDQDILMFHSLPLIRHVGRVITTY